MPTWVSEYVISQTHAVEGPRVMVYGFAFDKRVQPDDHIVAILGKRPHTEVIVNLGELKVGKTVKTEGAT